MPPTRRPCRRRSHIRCDERASAGPLVSAEVPVRALADLAAALAQFGQPVLATVRRASSQDPLISQGDVSLGSDRARATEHVDGTGVTVGVLSDSYRCNPRHSFQAHQRPPQPRTR